MAPNRLLLLPSSGRRMKWYNGDGSFFTITFPISKPDVQYSVSRLHDPYAPPFFQRKTMLIIEANDKYYYIDPRGKMYKL